MAYFKYTHINILNFYVFKNEEPVVVVNFILKDFFFAFYTESPVSPNYIKSPIPHLKKKPTSKITPKATKKKKNRKTNQ